MRDGNRRAALKLLSLGVGLAVLGMPSVVGADASYWGCLECRERTVLTFARDYCQQVGNEETGYTWCQEETWGLQQFCSLSGSACFNVEVGGGGGGGTGGGDIGRGGSSACTIRAGELCPAECFNCAVMVY